MPKYFFICFSLLTISSCSSQQLNKTQWEIEAKKNGFCSQDEEGFTVCFPPLLTNNK